MNNYQSIRSVGSKDIAQRRTINGELVEARFFSWEVMNFPPLGTMTVLFGAPKF